MKYVQLKNSPTLIKFGLRDEYKISEDYSYILEEIIQPLIDYLKKFKKNLRIFNLFYFFLISIY